jgi:hypothetical protein
VRISKRSMCAVTLEYQSLGVPKNLPGIISSKMLSNVNFYFTK